MGKFEDKLDYLDEERRKIWLTLRSLENEIKTRPSDYEKEAQNASRKASEFRNRCQESRDAAFKFQDEANAKLDEITVAHGSVAQLHQEISTYFNDIVTKSNTIYSLTNELHDAKQSIEGAIETLKEHLANVPTYDEHTKKLESLFDNNSDFINKTESLYKSLLVKKKDFDSLYRDIFGFTEKGEGNEEMIQVSGLKKELEDSFKSATVDIEALQEKIEKTRDVVTSQYKDFFIAKQSDVSKTMTNWETEYQTVYKKIEELLPNALTAGLSYAYSEKKNSEVNENKKLVQTFNISITFMVLASIIPFSFSAYSIYTGRAIHDVLLDMPKLVVGILPLYVPFLWLAYSASKKINLSKRLIEEYTHKEVLSKTFEGLSRQINDIDDNEVSADLRNRLLYNILEISAENPGKLITDYNKSDHPLMDALDKSVKLADAVEKLSKIPGFSKLTKTLELKSKKLVEDKERKITQGLNLVSSKSDEDEEADEETTTVQATTTKMKN